MDKSYQFNVLGLGETFLENNKKKLEFVTQLIVQETDKNGILVNEHSIEKESLPTKLLEIFDRGVSHLNNIKVLYIEHGLRSFLTEIEIF